MDDSEYGETHGVNTIQSEAIILYRVCCSGSIVVDFRTVWLSTIISFICTVKLKLCTKQK